MNKNPLKLKSGVALSVVSGEIVVNQPEYMATELFYYAEQGSHIILMDNSYYFNVAIYDLIYDEKYRHTYSYAPEQNWTTYTGNMTDEMLCQERYIFDTPCYFRVCLKRKDGGVCTENAKLVTTDILFFSRNSQMKARVRDVFIEEVQRVKSVVESKRTDNDLVLAVLTDSHYTVNGTWADTAMNLLDFNKKVLTDGLIHLGDLTDGMVSREATHEYSKMILDDLETAGVPVHVVLGNHDANYFGGNKDIFSLEEQVRLYQRNRKDNIDKPYYFTDYKKQKVRCIFLSAYANEKTPRYGFDKGQILWVKQILGETPADYKIVCFSHDAPLSCLDFWSETIRNGDMLMETLENHQYKKRNILAFVHGHTHADFIYQKRAFPIVSIGCAKCEDMLENKPAGAVTQKREPNTISQELWDVLIIKPAEETIHFIRFGAGEDRMVILRKPARIGEYIKKWIKRVVG